MRLQLLLRLLIAVTYVVRSTSGLAVQKEDGRARISVLRRYCDRACRRWVKAPFCTPCGSDVALMLTKSVGREVDRTRLLGSSISSSMDSPDASLSGDVADSDAATTRRRNLVLSIFPLQKSVRFPTESLTLNLYEHRYLALAEYALASQSDDPDSPLGWSSQTLNVNFRGVQGGQHYNNGRDRSSSSRVKGLFGALYSGSCPQLVLGGTGPITPIVQRGDVGVVFAVKSSQEAYVHMSGSTPRRRIRLVADGSARFRVDRIIQSGHGTESGPFITVEASLLSDLPLTRSEAAEFDRLVGSASVRDKL